MSNEEIHEYYGWLAHRLGFFEEWRELVSEKIRGVRSREYDTPRHRADYSREVFDEILSLKKENGDISDLSLIGINE